MPGAWPLVSGRFCTLPRNVRFPRILYNYFVIGEDDRAGFFHAWRYSKYLSKISVCKHEKSEKQVFGVFDVLSRETANLIQMAQMRSLQNGLILIDGRLSNHISVEGTVSLRFFHMFFVWKLNLTFYLGVDNFNIFV